MEWLDAYSGLLGAIGGILIADYFIVRRRKLDLGGLYREGGPYWYGNGIHWPGVLSLFAGTAVYWLIAFGVPELRSTITATIPTVIVAGGLYLLTARRVATSTS